MVYLRHHRAQFARRTSRVLTGVAAVAVRAIVVIGVTFLTSTFASAQEAAIKLLDGTKVVGRIEGWDSQSLTIATAASIEKLEIAHVLDVRWPRPKTSTSDDPYIELVDGSRLAYKDFALADRRATLALAWSTEPLTVKREAIRMAELRPATPQITAVMEDIDAKKQAGDALIVADREGQSMDYLIGVIHDLTADQASFEFEGDRLPVKRSRIAAMVFYQSKSEPIEPMCELSLVDGSKLVVSQATCDAGLVKVRTPAGLSASVPVEMIIRADFSAGKLQYLSDLTPSEVQWTPAVGLPPIDSLRQHGLPRSDSAFSGEPLSLAWKPDELYGRRELRNYEKGLAIRSKTLLTYRLPAGMRNFSAIAGLSPRDASSGSVQLKIAADDRVLWEGAINADRPQTLDLELGEARRLHITVDYGDNLDFGDQLHLVEACLTR